MDARTISGLYLFLATGQPPTDCTINEIIHAFHDARQAFLDRAGGDKEKTELVAGIRNQQNFLRCA